MVTPGEQHRGQRSGRCKTVTPSGDLCKTMHILPNEYDVNNDHVEKLAMSISVYTSLIL